MEQLPAEARAVVESGRLAHFTTLAVDGRPHTTIVWVGLDGDEIVIGKLQPDQKVANIGRDPRVSLSIEAEGDQHGMQNYLVVEGTARITEGGAPELLRGAGPALHRARRRLPAHAEPAGRLRHPRDAHAGARHGPLGHAVLNGSALPRQPSRAAASRSSVPLIVSSLRAARSSTPDISLLNSRTDSGRRSSLHSVTRHPDSVGSIR